MFLLKFLFDNSSQVNKMTSTAVDVSKLVGQIEPLLGSLSEIDLAGLVRQIQPILNSVSKVDISKLIGQVEPLLSSLNEIDLVGIVGQLQPILTAVSKIDVGKLIGQVEPLLETLSQINLAALVSLVPEALPIGDEGRVDLAMHRISTMVAFDLRTDLLFFDPDASTSSIVTAAIFFELVWTAGAPGFDTTCSHTKLA